MRDQLRHLLSIGRQPNIVIQVVPYGEGEKAGLNMTEMSILELPNGQKRIYSESLWQGHFIEDQERMDDCLDRYERTRGQALSRPESACPHPAAPSPSVTPGARRPRPHPGHPVRRVR